MDSTTDLYELTGTSPRMQELRRLITKLGRSECPLLILGETGTGKELVARSVHTSSGRGRFVVIDCAAIVPTLIESELFGRAKGAFTGATQAIGLMDAASGGTAFFDEIGELTLDVQAKLLRVIQYKEFRPVGSVNSHKVTCRIIGATNRNLAQSVRAGTFRDDLFYRLNVATIEIPPLRERKGDIHELIEYFLKRFNTNHRLTKESIDALVNFDWPGNVRELENCLRRLVTMYTGPLLGIESLPSYIVNGRCAQKDHDVTGDVCTMSLPITEISQQYAGIRSRTSGGATMYEAERRAILEALASTGGHMERAAKLLGVGRTTLYRKIKTYAAASGG